MAVQVRKGRKFDQVLDGARQVFMSDGFEGASVDDIARAANVSKATLYSYFPDKRLLFMEVCADQCSRQAEEAVQNIDMSQPPQVVLREAAERFLTFVLSDMGLKMFRMCVAEADRFPELGQQFYNSGPRVVQRVLSGYFSLCQERGELQIDDIDLAAFQFAELCKSKLWIQFMFGVRDSASAEEIDEVITASVDTFLARYGTAQTVINDT